MTKRLNGELIEREYLISAAPSDVLRYLDDLSKEIEDGCPLSDLTVEKLLGRNERTIDLGLARIVDDDGDDGDGDYIERILKRHEQDEDILTACLSNVTTLGFISQSKWLTSRLNKIAHEGTGEQIAALFKNEKLLDTTIVAALKREEPFESLAEERYYLILYHLLRNKKIQQEPSEFIDCDWDYDFGQHQIIQASWGLLLSLKPTQHNAELLWERIASFQELEVPSSFEKTISIDKEKGAVDTTEAFLRVILEKWATPTETNSRHYDPWGIIRQSTVQKIGGFHAIKLEEVILGSKDRYCIRGFFSSWDDGYSGKILNRFEEFLSLYGRDFLEGLILNDKTFLRSNRFGSKIFRAILQFKEDDSIKYDESLQDIFERRIEHLSRQPHAEQYIASAYAFEENDDDDQNQHSVELDQKINEIREKLDDDESSHIDYHRVVSNYLSKKVEHPDKSFRGQFWKVLRESFDGIREHAIKTKMEQDELEDELHSVVYELRNIQSILNPTFGKLKDKRDECTEAEASELEKQSLIVWSESNPARVFEFGFDDPNYKQIYLPELVESITEYFSKEYYRSKLMDYFILKACIFQEYVQYGEAIKIVMDEGKRSILGEPENYKIAKGVLRKIHELNSGKSSKRLLLILALMSVPSLFIGNKTPYLIGAFLLTIGISYLIYKWKQKKISKMLELYTSMREVWEHLDKLPFSPTRLKTLLDNSASKGVVWSNVAFCVADRMHADNSSIFIL